MADRPTDAVVPSDRKWTRRVASAVVAALFLAACLRPAVRVQGWTFQLFGDSEVDYRGAEAALYGWFSPFFLPWFANLFLLAGWLELIRGGGRWAAALGGMALALGASAWVFMVYPPCLLLRGVALTRLLTGYYLWQGSMIALVLSGLWVGGFAPEAEPGAAPDPTGT